jgi:hypothetical protein
MPTRAVSGRGGDVARRVSTDSEILFCRACRVKPLDQSSPDQSSDCFIPIQTVSMDASGNRVQDHNHDFPSSDYSGLKSVQNGDDSMTTSEFKGSARSRVPAFIAMLSAAIFTILLLPAYGQQEVDPTWYDPWVAPTAAAVHPAQPPAVVHSSQAHASPAPLATHRYQQRVGSASLAPHAAKLRGKDARLDQGRRNAARKNGEAEITVTSPAGASGRKRSSRA